MWFASWWSYQHIFFRSAEVETRSRWSLSSGAGGDGGGGGGGGSGAGAGGESNGGGGPSNFGPPNITPVGGVPNLKVILTPLVHISLKVEVTKIR